MVTVVGFNYPKPGPETFFWAGETGSCDADSVDNKSYNLTPGAVGCE